ncbi:hypothetical protein [Parvularcula dongshanensis]|uniref:DUF945 domain-containing protein n=1 Tax=Parvularcula dongshanensis TaxID=1173995 RepID=A0A840I220_9PROT|nr:hypothetical protein [Parvularcula dongshanensis]MBB4658312.1 hypothetical protein [Parvularcula dongshanensis]
MTPSRQKTALIVSALALATAGGASAYRFSKAESATIATQDGFRPYSARGAEPVDPAAYLSALGLDAGSYESASFDEEIGALVVTGIAPSGGDADVAIGRAELFAPDLDAARAIGSAASDLQAPFERLRLYDVTLTKDPCEDEGTEGCGADAGPGARPAPTMIRLGGAEVQDLRVRRPEAQGEDAVAAAAWLTSFAMGDVTLQDLVVTNENTVSVAQLTLNGYEEGRLGRVNLRALETMTGEEVSAVRGRLASMSPALAGVLNGPLGGLFLPENARTTIASLRWDGMSVAGLLPYLAAGEEPPMDADDMIEVGGAELRDQKTYVNGKLATSAARTTISDIDFLGYMPQRFSAATEGVTTDYSVYFGEEEAELLPVLKAQGLTAVKSSSRVDYAYDADADTIRFTSEGEAKDLFSSRLDARMSAFDHAAVLGGGEEALSAVAIDGITLTLEDEALIGALFAVYGAMEGRDPARLREGVAGTVTIAALQGQGVSPRVPDYADAVSQFVSEGGTLKISIDPSSPVVLGTLSDGAARPAQLIERLNLTVEREE